MASFRRVGKKWRAEVCCKGVRKSRVFHSKLRARAWADEQEMSIRDGIIGTSSTLAEALNKYADEVSVRHKGERWERVRLDAISRHPMAHKSIKDVTPADIAEWRDSRLGAVTGATVRREMGLLSAVFRVVRDEWMWISSSPMDRVRKPKTPPHRDRRISKEEEDALSSALSGQYLDIFKLALETGMRLGEICSIRQEDIKGKYLSLAHTKNGMPRNVPLSQKAQKIVQRAPFDTTPANASAVFYKAKKSLGIKDLRFHDTRHEAITRLAEKLDILELSRMVGIRDPKTLMIYYNKTAESIADKLD